MIVSFIIALVLAFVFTAIISVGFKRQGPGPFSGMFYFFLLILFVSWATGSWLYPAGPMVGNVPWLGYLIISLLVTFFIILVLPGQNADIKEQGQENAVAAAAFGFLFWAFIIILAGIAIAKGLFFTPAY
ncbi:MAG TPA: hypothetical protein VK154_14985 [Chitinophagales bacterium]|nr:hypothetical protein [Chitinophagales bacterium]